MTNTAYSNLTIVEKILKDLFWTPLKTAIEIRFPFLRFVVINTIWNVVMDYIFSLITLVIDVTTIRFVNAEHQQSFDREFIKLQIIARDHGYDSVEFKTERDAAALALSRFTRFGK